MSVETQILQGDYAPTVSPLSATDMQADISAVDTEVDSYETASGFGKMVNDIPLARKFKLFTVTLMILFVTVLGASALHFVDEQWAHTALIVEGVAGFVGIAWVILAASAIRRDFVDPLNTLISETRRLADGARDITLPGLERRDEVGELARTSAFLLKAGIKIDELYKVRDDAEKERLVNNEKRKQELRMVAEQFESTVGKIAANVASAASQLNATAREMATTAHGSSSQAQELVDAMQSAASSVASAAAASDEFAMSIAEISRQASQSERLARETSTVAAGTDKTISALSDSADEVSQIVELIQSIAGRTNILALNASIEAARGGETGRGFAVVASEVKELASRTSKATDDVTEQIHSIQASTRSGVEELHDIGERVKELETTAIAIATAVDQQSVAGKDLAHSIDLAARGTDAVSANASDLLDQANAVGSAADQLLGSAKGLEEQASLLTDQAKDFVARVQES